MNKLIIKTSKERRVKRIRAKIKSLGRQRKLCVFRSNRYISAQIVDLSSGKTLLGLAERSLTKKALAKSKTERAHQLGKEIAKKAIKMGIKKVVFDRGPYRYHGRVKALAEGAREGGLIL